MSENFRIEAADVLLVNVGEDPAIRHSYHAQLFLPHEGRTGRVTWKKAGRPMVNDRSAVAAARDLLTALDSIGFDRFVAGETKPESEAA